MIELLIFTVQDRDDNSALIGDGNVADVRSQAWRKAIGGSLSIGPADVIVVAGGTATGPRPW